MKQFIAIQILKKIDQEIPWLKLNALILISFSSKTAEYFFVKQTLQLYILFEIVKMQTSKRVQSAKHLQTKDFVESPRLFFYRTK